MDRLNVILLLFFSSPGVFSTSVYEPLVNHIKSKTDPRLIPRESADRPLVVDFQASWLDIQDVHYDHNEIEGIFMTTVDWHSSITWNPADFNGKKSVVLSSYEVYHPVMTILNAVGKLETWNGERVSFYANGKAVLRVHFRGRIFCNEELQEADTCKIRVASYSTPSDVISFMEPSERSFDLTKINHKYYFKGSRFNVTSQSYEIYKQKADRIGFVFEYMDYIFSFEELESKVNNGPIEFMLEF